jgi:hypothetical protein
MSAASLEQHSFELLHEAATRATKHIFQNRAHRVSVPSPQAAVEQRTGVTPTRSENDNAETKQD